MNKLSLVGMQLPEKYKENFNVSSKGLLSKVTSRGGSPYIFQVVETKACSYYWYYLHWHMQTVQDVLIVLHLKKGILTPVF